MGHPLLQIPFLARRPDRMSQRGLDRDNRGMLSFVLTVNCLPSGAVKPTKLSQVPRGKEHGSGEEVGYF